MKLTRMLSFLGLLSACATPVLETRCIPDLCSSPNACETCDGYDEADAIADPLFRVCPVGAHVRVCCDGEGCHRLDRDPECAGTIAVCSSWVGVNTFDTSGEWLREGTCYVESWKR
jgi:hypothetical protein